MRQWRQHQREEEEEEDSDSGDCEGDDDDEGLLKEEEDFLARLLLVDGCWVCGCLCPGLDARRTVTEPLV